MFVGMSNEQKMIYSLTSGVSSVTFSSSTIFIRFMMCCAHYFVKKENICQSMSEISVNYTCCSCSGLERVTE